jgi:hypothetical protein
MKSTNPKGGKSSMEDLLLLFSLDDFFALLALCTGVFGSVFCVKRFARSEAFPLLLAKSTEFSNINPRLVETYPPAARRQLLYLLFRRVQHFDAENAKPALLV